MSMDMDIPCPWTWTWTWTCPHIHVHGHVHVHAPCAFTARCTPAAAAESIDVCLAIHVVRDTSHARTPPNPQVGWSPEVASERGSVGRPPALSTQSSGFVLTRLSRAASGTGVPGLVSQTSGFLSKALKEGVFAKSRPRPPTREVGSDGVQFQEVVQQVVVMDNELVATLGRCAKYGKSACMARRDAWAVCQVWQVCLHGSSRRCAASRR
jgi:hypothetical protein